MSGVIFYHIIALCRNFKGFYFLFFFMNSSSYTLNTLTTDAGAAYIVPEYDLEFRLYLLFWGNSFTAWLI
jgi:hypothetical protein